MFESITILPKEISALVSNTKQGQKLSTRTQDKVEIKSENIKENHATSSTKFLSKW